MKPFTVRQAGPGDEEALADLDRLCFSHPWSLDSYRREMRENPFAVYILAESVEEDDAPPETGSSGPEAEPAASIRPRLMGYVGIWVVADEGHITNVAVHPDDRGCGVARVLLKLMLDYCRSHGIFDVTLEVRRSNEPALRLYRGFGFREEGVRKAYYDDGEDALIMWRREKKKGTETE